MAKTTRTETARRSRNNARVNRGMYVEGNTVRRLAEVPERTRQPQRPYPGKQQPNRNRRVQAQPAPVPKQKHQLSKEEQTESSSNELGICSISGCYVCSYIVLLCEVSAV